MQTLQVPFDFNMFIVVCGLIHLFGINISQHLLIIHRFYNFFSYTESVICVRITTLADMLRMFFT